MKIINALRQSVYGWIMILRNEAGWQERFRFTGAGLVTALVLFYLFAFLSVVLASLDVGVPTLQGLFDIMLIQSLWLVALLAGAFGTRFALRETGAVLPILVPGIYGLIYYLVLGTLISFAFGVLLPILWLGLGWLLFCLGRRGGGWTIGVSAAFAVLTVVLLVGTPLTLYMLTAPVPAA